MMGLGSIVGTGVFVSIGIGYVLADAYVLPAIFVATLVATLNGLSSAQLAANHPVSGGTYAYGYKWLTPSLGFSAGTMFLVAKSASAATAALACATILLDIIGVNDRLAVTGAAIGIVGITTVLVVGGLKRSNVANLIVVSITLLALACVIVVGLWQGMTNGGIRNLVKLRPNANVTVVDFLKCCGLMFVAFTGYGRIATLGEEIVEPRINIPRAIVLTLVFSGILYALVGLVFVICGPQLEWDGELSSPRLEDLAQVFDVVMLEWMIRLGALTAMLGVLLNLVLGLSRVYFAMGRNDDLPASLGRVSDISGSPILSVWLTGLVIAGLTLMGDIRWTWSFSAFTVLVYYALTNLAATRLTPAERYCPALLSWLGFTMCLSLAFFISPVFLAVGSGILVVANLCRWLLRSNES